MLLAIDTSAGTSVAIVDRDRTVIVEHTEPDTRRHAEVVGILIGRCLSDSATRVPELAGVVIGMGPGPFTGLRVGIAAGNAFALGADLPTLRVISHDAIAFERYSAGASGALLVVTDARRREVYWSTYSGTDDAGLPQRVGEPGLARPEELPIAVSGYTGYTRVDADAVSAGAAGMLAERIRAHHRPFASPEPLYLRSPDVTVPAGPKRVS